MTATPSPTRSTLPTCSTRGSGRTAVERARASSNQCARSSRSRFIADELFSRVLQGAVPADLQAGGRKVDPTPAIRASSVPNSIVHRSPMVSDSRSRHRCCSASVSAGWVTTRNTVGPVAGPSRRPLSASDRSRKRWRNRSRKVSATDPLVASRQQGRCQRHRQIRRAFAQVLQRTRPLGGDRLSLLGEEFVRFLGAPRPAPWCVPRRSGRGPRE